MYLHCKYGFFEADAWDGTVFVGPVGDQHTALCTFVARLQPNDVNRVIIVRSRSLYALTSLLEDGPASIAPSRERERILSSPPSWDYPFRAYVTDTEWACLLVNVARDLDYRNFKHWTATNAPEQKELAEDIWTVAHDAAKRASGPPRKSGIGAKRQYFGRDVAKIDAMAAKRDARKNTKSKTKR